MGEAVSRQLAPMLAALSASEARVELLARENGRLLERIAVLERELSGVRQVTDTAPDRQEATQEPNLGAESGDPTPEPSDPPTERPEPPWPPAPDPLPPTTDGRQPWWRRLVRWGAVL